SSTTAVGLLSPRSISEIIERLTPLLLASASSEMACAARSSRTRAAMRWLRSDSDTLFSTSRFTCVNRSPEHSSIHRPKRRGKDQLIEGEIEPAAEFESNLAHRGAMYEPQTFMEPDARFVRCINATDQHVVILGPRSFDDRRLCLPKPSCP